MSSEGIQNELGYFGKLPTLGDFVHQVLPQDFANGWHEWLQQCMAQAREALADDFLTYYLNCPVWKFLMAPGVCGAQAVVGLTIPSVDKVGRYFNFTLATVLPPEADPCAYVLGNRDGLTTLEELALDILEMDYPKEEIELKVRELSLQFNMTSNARQDIESEPGFVTWETSVSGGMGRKGRSNHKWWYAVACRQRTSIYACSPSRSRRKRTCRLKKKKWITLIKLSQVKCKNGFRNALFQIIIRHPHRDGAEIERRFLHQPGRYRLVGRGRRYGGPPGR
jgi:type VI secretion system ImpM family protein